MITSQELTKEKIKEVLLPELERAFVSTRRMGELFFPHHLTRPFGKIHNKLFEYLDDPKREKVAIAAPRGFGKSTIVNLLFASRIIYFHLANYVVLVSSTETKANEELRTLKSEMENNERLIAVFGNIIGKEWTKEFILTNTGVRVRTRGAGQQVRGLKEGRNRPQVLIIDDLEDSKTVASESQTKALKRWFYSDLINVLSNEPKDFKKIVYIGTVLGENSLLASLKDDPEWAYTTLELFDDNLNSNYPEFMTTEKIKALYEAYKERGLLDVFYEEFKNIAMSPETAPFRKEMFQYFKFEELRDKNLEKVVIVDPSKTVNVSSDYSAIVGIGVDYENHFVYFLDCVNAKLHPDEIYEESFKMADRIGTPIIGVETTSLEEFILLPFKEAASRRGGSYDIVGIPARGNKLDRIRGLVPFYRSGRVKHNPLKHISQPLENQLLTFPYCKNFDVIDAFAHVIKLLDLGNSFFSILPFESKETNVWDVNELEDLGNWRYAP